MSFAPGEGVPHAGMTVYRVLREQEKCRPVNIFTNNSNILYKKNIFSAKNVLLICSKISYKKYKI